MLTRAGVSSSLFALAHATDDPQPVEKSYSQATEIIPKVDLESPTGAGHTRRLGRGLGTRNPPPAMNTWTTEMRLPALPQQVLELLTEPEAIAQWAPIPFELLDVDAGRLQTGTRARVRGGLAGRRLEF